MTPELKSRIQIFLVVALVLAAVRVAYIFHQRNATTTARRAANERRSLTADEYVVPRKVYAHDLASARSLAGKPVWIKQGYGNLAYPIRNGNLDLDYGAATLLPLERLEVKDVVLRSAPATWKAPPGESELLAICARPDSSFVAVPIGNSHDGDFHLTFNDVFYIQDPHQLYSHWSNDVWKAIDAHEAKLGMNELQVNFALGIPQTTNGGDYGDRALVYSNRGSPVSVSFSHNKATEITAMKK